MSNQCNTCSDPRPDALRTVIQPVNICGTECESCTDNCPVEEYACPVHLNGMCVHYTGCETFLTQLHRGMTFDQAMINIENLFNQLDRLLESYKSRIIELDDRVKDLEEQLATGRGCVNGFQE